MCGILGELSTQGDLLESKPFADLLSLSRNRGPDGTKTWKDERCQLGFNRLAILELSDRALQPLSSPSGRFQIVFNGEIFNFRDLAKRHGLRDPLCRSSDAVLLAHLCDSLEIEALAGALDGMFAIALYDRAKRELCLMRDFAGIKPLFYGNAHRTIVFASQFDQIFRHPCFRNASTCPDVLHDYLRLGYMPAPNTLLEGIHQLEPGQLITFREDLSQSTTVFTQFPGRSEGCVHPETGTEAAEASRSALDRAIKATLVSDVPLGCFVSGGVDSPLVAAYAASHAPELTAYTVGVNDSALNEADIARAYCDRLKLSQKILQLDENEIVSSANDHFKAFPDPVGDYSSLPTFAITREARRHVTVMLSGDGGDELFWGYPRFLKFLDQKRLLSLPGLLRRGLTKLRRAVGRSTSHGVAGGLSAWVLDTQSHFVPSDLASLVPETRFSDTVRDLYAYDGDYSTKSLGHWLRYNEFYGHMQRVLAKVDRASMGNSLEVRVPFLCKDVVNAAWSLQCQLGEAHRELKWILKRDLQNRLGIEINHKKMGFTVPINEWLRTCFQEEVRELSHHPVFGDSIIDFKYAARFTDQFFAGHHDHGWGIWILYSLQKWAMIHLKVMR
jgi:asparagine synthase (glutamine-hydrolysing)